MVDTEMSDFQSEINQLLAWLLHYCLDKKMFLSHLIRFCEDGLEEDMRKQRTLSYGSILFGRYTRPVKNSDLGLPSPKIQHSRPCRISKIQHPSVMVIQDSSQKCLMRYVRRNR